MQAVREKSWLVLAVLPFANLDLKYCGQINRKLLWPKFNR
jgi:hypothetical protein